MNTNTTWFRAIACLLSGSLMLAGCGSAPKTIEPSARAITAQVMVGDHVDVEVAGNRKYEFWVTAVNDTRLQGTEGPNDQGRPVDIAIADIQAIRIYESDDWGGGGGRNSALTTALVLIGVIAAFVLFAEDDAEDRFQSEFPNP